MAHSTANGRVRRRRAKASVPAVRVTNAPPRRMVHASRRVYFDLLAPRLTLNLWPDRRAWEEARPRICAALVLLALAFGLYQIFSANLFFVDGVTVSGNRLLPRSEIETAAGVRGWNLFFVNPRDVEAAIGQLPEVKQVRVSLSLPNRVLVQIQERHPLFVWQSGGLSYWVDDDGIALRARGDWPAALVIRDLDAAPVQIGSRVNAEAFNAAVSLRNAWPDGPRSFEWSRRHGLAVRDPRGWPVYFGDASQMADKLAALKIITAQLGQDKKPAAFIDLGSGLPYFQELIASK